MEEEKKQSKAIHTTIFFLLSCFSVCVFLWFSPPFAPGEKTRRQRQRDPLRRVYSTTPVASLTVEEDVKEKRKRENKFGMEGNYQMGRGEWQNGSLASHARRRQRR
jgi:hypothetical protein